MIEMSSLTVCRVGPSPTPILTFLPLLDGRFIDLGIQNFAFIIIVSGVIKMPRGRAFAQAGQEWNWSSSIYTGMSFSLFKLA